MKRKRVTLCEPPFIQGTSTQPVLEVEDDDPDLQFVNLPYEELQPYSDLIGDVGIHAKSLPIEMCWQLFKINR
jgi:hypothetical protein